MDQKFTEFEFNYASIKLDPYSGDKGTSSQLLKKIIHKLREEDFPIEKKIIDRHSNRKNTLKRNLVIISNQFSPQGQRCFGKIALIKNKSPLLWGGKDLVEEIEKEHNKEFIEITNYCIHFSQDSDPVIMFEFNNDGPRLSDIEYYIRQIAKDFKIAKNIQTSIHLIISYEQLDKELSNVYGVTVKVNSAYNNRFNWFKELREINNHTGYKDVRLELFFNRARSSSGQFIKNIRGLDFARGIIEWLKKDKNNIKYLEDLKMTYQTNNDESIVDLDFKKNKVLSYLKIPLFNGKVYKSSDYKEMVGKEFNIYLNSGKTTIKD